MKNTVSLATFTHADQIGQALSVQARIYIKTPRTLHQQNGKFAALSLMEKRQAKVIQGIREYIKLHNVADFTACCAYCRANYGATNEETRNALVAMHQTAKANICNR